MPRFAVSTTPLVAGDTWISDSLIPSSADRLTGGVVADQAGTLFIEQSLDNGAHWDISQQIAVAANTPVTFSVEVLVSPCRVRFVNGATPQGVFRIKANFQSAGARP